MSVPKLRFKEFDGDWSNKKIGNIASKVGSGSTPRGGAEAYTDHGIIFIRSQNVNNDQLLLDDVAYIPEETHVKMSGSKVIANDILLNITGASIGRSCVVPHDFTEANVNQHVCIIRTPNDDPIFVQSFLSSENGQNAIQSKQAGGGREGLNFQAIRSIDFHFPPSKEEQAKIASFLSNVDEKISQLNQKHELLSQYKQGMMQKLFSQHIRFKADDGSEFAKWEDSKLGELTILITKGTTPSSLGEKYEESGINFIKIESLSSNGKFLLDKFAYIDENTHNKLARSKLEHDDILFSIAGALGRVAIISRDYLPANTNQALAIIRLKDKKITRYIYYFLNSDYVKKIIDSESVQLAQANFSLGQLANLDVLVPCLEEQTKIANFLSAIDQKIEVVAQQIEQAKTWKKGLLQQMFV
ncbi:restriction endonuclease subunit S [Acinetobacter indicus]|uniref:restriction endonuclease subunit S n=1 Tax=Acinetobacter indicus TaxID=756892 RepID=UPI00197C46E1|nr:restriction endonuclease subunit S [Acinetobacter indicus]QSG83963.1 restriction endonuclease subunit S [Acinetobacter indicus]